MDYVLRTHELTKVYGKRTVVDKVSMNIAKGDIYGFIGRNGAGKTTAMKMMLGMIFPNGGSTELFGGEANDNSRRRVGSLIEAPALYKNCTAYENLKRFSILFGGDRKNIKEILEIVNLQDTGKKPAGKFSLGMKQRLGIAIAMLGNPELLILDEPVNGLDPTAIKQIRDTIININQEKGVTFLISSHLLGELSKISTRYGIINNGQLVEEITAQELEAGCRQKLTIRCRNTEKAENILRSKFSINNVEREENAISIYDCFDRAEEINAALVTDGAGVYDFHISNSDIEEYFLERIGK
ncbi:MAG: ABC transporter ATP-binding protein [Porcipelethomonas sp.]